MDVMSSLTPTIPQYGGTLDFNGNRIAGCVRCGWRGVPNTVGGKVVRRPRLVRNPDAGVWEQKPGEVEGSQASTVCLICGTVEERESEIEWLLRQAREAERAANPYVGTPRNALCPCGSGVKYKKCCGR